MPVGPNKTTAGLSGAIPQQSLTGTTRYTEKRLFYSQRDIALILPKTIRGGFGILEAGQVMAKIRNQADPNGDEAQGVLIPYMPVTSDPSSIDHADTPGCCPVLADPNGGTTVYVDLERSWMFKVGDECILEDNSDSPESCYITAIDRTTYDYQATLTVGASVSGNFTPGNKARIFLRQDAGSSTDSSGEELAKAQNKAEFILDQTIDTGFEDQGGALGSVVISNAILYSDSLVNCDTQAETDLGLTEDGQFYILT